MPPTRVGAIVGALAMSLFVITAFGSQNGERILIVLAAAAALVALVPFGRDGRAGPACGPATCCSY